MGLDQCNEPHLAAMASSLSRGTYQVVFSYTSRDGRHLFDMPSFNLPCRDLDHAIKVTRAFNDKE